MSSDPQSDNPNSTMPSPAVRVMLTIMITGYLGVVLLGPLSKPIASENLTQPLARAVEPMHQALFLGHGYRFFGPDPGPSHLLRYKVDRADGTEVTGQFPDRQSHWPRLLYHRWFMLSETVYEDCFFLQAQSDHESLIADLNVEIEQARFRGELSNMHQLATERDRLKLDHEYRKTRTQGLLQQIANYLIDKHEGQFAELFLVERLIARPVDVASRVKLNDPRFLSEPRSMGTFESKPVEKLETIE